ncbi:MAG: hypothetical protein LBJ20_03680 [Candidatus Methanoplasma sp.]|jgi:hypothetical protein|nr:hypothetical protein [Candidatus Methanoplasma sp.]
MNRIDRIKRIVQGDRITYEESKPFLSSEDTADLASGEDSSPPFTYRIRDGEADQ